MSDGTAFSPRLADLSPQLRLSTLAAAMTLSAAALTRFGIDANGIILAALCSVLALISAFDLEHRLIPNRVVLPAIGLILAARLAFSDPVWEWPAAGLGAGLILFVPTLFRAGAVGMGDVKLAVLLGVGLGGDGISALLIGSLALVPVAIWILMTRGISARHDAIPLGPFLAVGGIVAAFLA